MNQRGFLASERISNIRGSNEFDGLNLCGVHHQMNVQNSGLLQPLQQQQSGFSDIQHLQQQLMLKKMQELRRQKSMQQVDTRQHNFVNQASLFARQPTDHCSDDLINPVRMGFIQQQDDHSLHAVPVSGSTDKALTRQIPTYGNSFPGNQHHTSGQGLTSWINMEQVQQVKPTYQAGSDQMFKGQQDLTSPSEISQDESTMPSLDPEEEKFLFGSDVNIWEAFGSDRTSNLQDDNAYGSGIPSIQSGSWSALMQSAVAESTGSGTSLLEEMTGLTSQNLQYPSDRPPSSNEIDNSLQNSQSNDGTQVMHEELAHGDGTWRVDAHSNSFVDPTPTSTSMDSQQINEVLSVNTAASTPKFSNMHGGIQFGQLPSNSHQLNYWKHVASTVKAQHHLNQVSESSFNSSDKEDVNLHEIESQRNRESFHDSYHSTSFCQPISDAADVRVQSDRLTSAQQKFRYHPMENLDEDVPTPYWKTQVINTTPMSLQHFGGLRGQDQESLGHTKVSSQVSADGQNMLELIHKVDQSRDGGTRRLECNLSSETLEADHLDGSLEGPQRSQSLNSQGFGIHLLPLSQQLSEAANASTSLSWVHISSNLRDKGQPALASWSPFQETPHAGFKNNSMGNLGSVFSSSWRQLQNHQIISSRSQLNIAKSTCVEQDENRGNLFPNIGTSSLNSQGIAFAGEQSTKGSTPPVSSAIVDHGQRMNGPLGKISVIDALPVNPTTNQIDLEAFGHSLTTYNIAQNSFVRNQMSATGKMDHHPFDRVTKRLKRSDSLLDGQVESQSSVLSNSMTIIKAEHSHISPQMAPSWFDTYGTFKTDQLHETVGKVKSVVQPFNIEKLSGDFEIHGHASSAADTTQVGVISKSHVLPLVAREQPSLLPMDARIQSLFTLRPTSHILTTVDLCPWLVEVSGSFKNLKGICTGAVEWSRATNLLMEKVDDDGDMIEDVLPILRPKKRLIVATLLMQQLLRPPPAAILSLDACSNYESVVFYGTRLALGDASNLVSSAKSYSSFCHGRANGHSDESEQSERIDDHLLSKVVEDFTSKAGKLEDDLLRHDKRTSILDLKEEFQDLERFSIINRFAKFHGRGQSDMAESSSNAPASRPFPQRYVTAVPLPLNLPDRVQCLSL